MPKIVTVDASTSTVTSNVPNIEGDGVEAATITIQVRNTDGNPMQGLAAANIVLAVSGTGNTVTQPTGVTNRNGEIAGSFVSTTEEIKTCSYTVLGVPMTDTAAVEVADFVAETVDIDVWWFS